MPSGLTLPSLPNAKRISTFPQGIVKLRVYALNQYALRRVLRLAEQQYLESPSMEIPSA
jgi:hypothetical protein